jgi:hypothetical protein
MITNMYAQPSELQDKTVLPVLVVISEDFWFWSERLHFSFHGS